MGRKIRLLAIDSKIPNYAIMKISAYHRKLGDDVDWYNPLFDLDTDILYISKIFTFTKDIKYLPINAKIIKGGSGYSLKTKLSEEIENIKDLDYSLYPNCDYSLVFASRGCIRKCKFCVVPDKEGLIHNVDLPKVNKIGKYIKILDNNFFANPNWRNQLKTLKSYNQPLEFNQGIDLRILNQEQCRALETCKIKEIKCAWDNYRDKDIIIPKLQMLLKYIKPYKIVVYVLVGFENKNIVETDVERVMILKKMGVRPYAMAYVDFNDPNYLVSQDVKDFCRWVNMRACFMSCDWNEYKYNKGANM